MEHDADVDPDGVDQLCGEVDDMASSRKVIQWLGYRKLHSPNCGHYTLAYDTRWMVEGYGMLVPLAMDLSKIVNLIRPKTYAEQIVKKLSSPNRKAAQQTQNFPEHPLGGREAAPREVWCAVGFFLGSLTFLVMTICLQIN